MTAIPTIQDVEALKNLVQQLEAKVAKLETLHQPYNQQSKCPICGGTDFDEREVLLSTTGATFLGLDWTNPSATGYICKKCKHIMLFGR
jgi:predicted nucleic-acid-binding Zn-ribbon protein